MKSYSIYIFILLFLGSCSPLIVNVDTGAKYKTLKEAIDNVNEGDSLVIYPGKYIDSSFIYLGKDYVKIVGIGKPQLLCTSMQENVLWVQSDHILIKGIKASHIKPDFWANCTGNVFALDNANDVVIENCEINGCGRIGVYMFSAKGVVLKNNWIHNNSLCAVQLDDLNLFTETDKYIEYVKFINNRIMNNGNTNINEDSRDELGE